MKTTAHLQMDLLIEKYNTGHSASFIAREHKVSVWSIITRLRESGVEIRSIKEQLEKRLAESSSDFNFLEIIDGVLLGYGQIDPKGLLHLEQSNVRKGWILQVRRHLKSVGCECKLLKIGPRTRVIEGRKVRSNPATHLYTPAYKEMQDQRARWYPRGKRHVPRDLVLTPVVFNHWFCGDGTYNTNGQLILCTNGFKKSDVDFLVERLALDLDVYSCRGRTDRKGQYVIRFDRHDETMKLKELLDPLISKCCRYKLRFVRPKKRMGRFTVEQVRKIRARRENGESLRILADDFEVSTTAIGNIATRKVYKNVQ